MGDDQLAYAVVGCGVVGPVHAEAAAAHPGARLTAVCDVIPERAQSCAEQFAATAYTDCARMLAQEAPAAVSVCTPHHDHAETSIACLEAGAHVLCEKPLAISGGQMDAMIETAEREGRILAGVFQHRFDPTTRAVKEAVDEGIFGRPLNVGASLRCRKDRDYYDSGSWRGTWDGEGGAVLINQSIHSIDVMQWLGGPVAGVCGRWTNLKFDDYIEAEDTACASLQFASGALGSIEATSASHYGFRAEVHFYGEHGSFRLSTAWPNDLLELELDAEDRRERLKELMAGAGKEDETPLGKDYYGSSHGRQIADFIEAIRQERPPFVTARDARPAVEIVLAIYESVRTGRPVVL